MSESGLRRMRVSVDEARENSFPAEIDFLGTTGCAGEDFLVGAAGKESSVGDCDCLCSRLTRAHGPDIGVVKDKIWFGSIYGQPNKSSGRAKSVQKFAARSGHGISEEQRATILRRALVPLSRARLNAKSAKLREDGV